jgi:hypothetical protein
VFFSILEDLPQRQDASKTVRVRLASYREESNRIAEFPAYNYSLNCDEKIKTIIFATRTIEDVLNSM